MGICGHVSDFLGSNGAGIFANERCNTSELRAIPLKDVRMGKYPPPSLKKITVGVCTLPTPPSVNQVLSTECVCQVLTACPSAGLVSAECGVV